MSVVGNILEQEDELKGLTNDRLLQEIQNPSGLFLAFLPPSEMQRRNEMRERYEGNQEQPTNTIVEQIVTEGLGGMGPISPQDNSSMLPTGMPPQTMGSPIPTDPNFQPLPVVAAAGEPPPLAGGMALGSDGLGGMGGLPQRVSGGGIVGMQGGGSLWDAYKDRMLGRGFYEGASQDTDDHMRGRAILAEKGLDWRDYGDAYVNAVGAKEGTMGIFPPRFLSSRDPEEYQKMFGSTETEGEVVEKVPYWKEEDYVPPLDILDAYSGEGYGGTGAISPEIARAQTGADRWDQISAETERRHASRDEYPYAHLTPFEQSLLPTGQEKALQTREAVKGIWDWVAPRVAGVGEEIGDFYTTAKTGSTDPVEQQREEIRRQKEAEQAAEQAAFRQSGADIYNEGLRSSLQAELQAELDVPESYDPFDPTNERFRQAQAAEGATTGWLDKALTYQLPPDRLRPMQAGEGATTGWFDKAMNWLGDPEDTTERLNRLSDSALTEDRTGWLDRVADFLGYDAEVSGGTDDDGADAVITDGGTTLPRLTSAGTDVEGGTQFMPAGQTPALNTSGLNINALIEDYKKRGAEIEVRAEEGEAEAMKDIERLITKTQDDARGDALNAWLMNVGAGVASGDMGAGLEKGAQALGDIKKDARDAVRSLDATRLSRYFDGSKAEMDRLVAMAGMDAGFANALVSLIVEQGRAGRADKILISSIVDAMLNDMTGKYAGVDILDLLKTAQSAVTGIGSDVSGDMTYNMYQAAIE